MPETGGEYARILSLARSGATSQAWDIFVAAGLDRVDGDFDALTLKGRLLKDRARQTVAHERTTMFDLARNAYEQAAALRQDSYPLINASAMALFAGDRVRSELLASKVLNLIESGADKGETPYWCEATRAEALLLLGRQADAAKSFQNAVEQAPTAWEDRAATLRQFALIAAQTNADVAWLDRFRPPAVLHYSGILGIAPDDQTAAKAIQATIEAIAPGFAFGALAAGADIIAAEYLVASGAELNVALPSDPSDFHLSSVAPFGADWEQRFGALLDNANSVAVCGSNKGTSAAGVMLAEYHAMGMVAELARQLETRAVALRIEPAGRPVLGDLWLKSGREIHLVEIEGNAGLPSAPLPKGELVFDVAIDGAPPETYPDLDEALEVLAKAGDQIAALDCRLDEHQRVRTLLAHGEAGMLVASRSAALALLASGAVGRVESLGEIATPAGSIDICLAKLTKSGG
ncbi:tetratricopeptide repeat-containing protein [Sphingorhabdus sp.]|uniref:tetratricopeptide repeat-containing protein n=1 Tax=Sphingorhabdus sp. TaxID=1902408 RepID=UPI0032B81FF0